VQPKTRNSCDHPILPVMITGTKISQTSNQVTYILCMQYGHLRGTFHRESIQFEEHMTADMVKISLMEEDMDAHKMTVEEASAKHIVLGGKAFCRCKKDCILVPKCSCIALGKLCREKYHGKEGHKVHCLNCVMELHQSHNYPTRKINK
jgi:hypothetical protein